MDKTIQDKSLFYYGGGYHILIDPITRQHRAQVIARIPPGVLVLDVGCGTGELALALHEEKNCQVVGIDLSRRMVDYARDRNPYAEVAFLHRDASNIPDFEENHFAYGVLCQILHELPEGIRLGVLRETLRLCQAVLLLDYHSPLPSNGPAMISRLIEATIGRDHHPNFKAYLEAGGLEGLCKQAGVGDRIREQQTFNQGCHQWILLE